MLTSGFSNAWDKCASEVYFSGRWVKATADNPILALGRSKVQFRERRMSKDEED
ncbi:MAG: hypothetical protein V7L00_10105 [Nostoc sp.]|uniref:hypothetical protein n=1 Tax=unclassified Nostoc TaxID=2593658 RepID=UPI0025F8B658|nr:hypothetical protein [Nostoc sp. JL33]MBN3874641.1 hypothetical protein [Nostoc sp. JL33]